MLLESLLAQKRSILECCSYLEGSPVFVTFRGKGYVDVVIVWVAFMSAPFPKTRFRCDLPLVNDVFDAAIRFCLRPKFVREPPGGAFILGRQVRINIDGSDYSGFRVGVVVGWACLM